MFRFEKEQEVYNIGGIRIGGQPGENPVVLIGSIFYEGHKIVEDEIKGTFDKKEAERLVNKQEEMSTKTGIPHALDVVGSSSSEALMKYIDFISDITDAPLLIDSTNPEIRLKASRHAIEIGLKNRVIYNSINPHIKDEEIRGIKEAGIEAAIILAFSHRHFRPRQKLDLLTGDENEAGLLQKAKNAGVGKVLIDPGIVDVPSVAPAVSSIHMIKEKLGLPAGCAPCNSLDMWKRLSEFGDHAKITSLTSAATIAQCMGANFILYGPIRRADIVFPACAMTDAIITYNNIVTHGFRPKHKDLPLYKIF